MGEQTALVFDFLPVGAWQVADGNSAYSGSIGSICPSAAIYGKTPKQSLIILCRALGSLPISFSLVNRSFKLSGL